MRVSLSWAAALVALSLSCGSQMLSKGINIDRAFRNLIWPDATVLAGADLQTLKGTDFYRRHSKDLDLSALNDSSTRFGFDPRSDVNLLLLESDSRRSLLLAKANLKASEIKQKLGGMGVRSTTYHSFQLLGDANDSLTILNNSVAVGGSAQAVRSALDLSEKNAGSVPAELQKRLEAIPKNSQIWIVSREGLPFATSPMRSDIQSLLSNIVAYVSGSTAGLQVDGGVNLNATISCVSAVGAQRVHDALKGGIALARLSTQDDEVDLLKTFDAIEVNQNGNEVLVKAALNSAEVDKLMTYLPQLHGRVGRRLAQ